MGSALKIHNLLYLEQNTTAKTACLRMRRVDNTETMVPYTQRVDRNFNFYHPLTVQKYTQSYFENTHVPCFDFYRLFTLNKLQLLRRPNCEYVKLCKMQSRWVLSTPFLFTLSAFIYKFTEFFSRITIVAYTIDYSLFNCFLSVENSAHI